MPPKKPDNAIEMEQEVDCEKVIVTGAGSGIGKELVKLFLQTQEQKSTGTLQLR